MSFTEIKTAIDKIGEAFDAYKHTNDARLEAMKKGDEASARELAAKLERIETDVTRFTGLKAELEREHQLQRERIEALEARASNPKKTAAEQISSDYLDSFLGWIRAKGQSPLHEQKMADLQRKAAAEAKTITIGTPSAGGYAVPEEIARAIEQLERKFSPVRRLVKVVPTNSSDYKELINVGGASSGWVGESDARPMTGTPTLREVAPTHGELYAYPQVSEWSLDDVFFNVEQWLSEAVAQEFALQEGVAVISGNGTNKPTGLLNTTPVLTADETLPARAATAFQYIASDNGGDGAGILADALLDTVYTLNSAYRAGSAWIMNSLTTGAVRKLKTADGAYHWQPGLQVGQPDMLLGYPVETWEQMPDIAPNAFPVGFGNWRRAYVLTDRVGMRITRDNVTAIGFVKFYVRRREGGIVLNNDAAKFIRTV